MDMKSNLILFFLFFVFCSCTDDEQEEQATGSVKFTAETENALFKGLQEGATTGIYVVGRTGADVEGTLLAAGNVFDNQKFIFSGKILTPESKIYYPENVPAFDIYAYAPYSEAGLNDAIQLPFTVESSQANPAASDLLWAVNNGIKPASGAANLSFKHVLSKIEINLKAGTGVTLDVLSVQVGNSLPSTLLDMKTGKPGPASGTAKAILAKSVLPMVDAATFEAIIIPQTINVLSKFLTVVNGDKTYYYDLEAAKEFKTGTVYKYNITINQNDLEITLSGDVTDWLPGDTTDANLTKN